MVKNNIEIISEFSISGFISSHRYIIFTILLFSIFPIVSSQLYFRHDDSLWLLWASEFDKSFLYVFHPDPQINNSQGYGGMGAYYRPFAGLYVMLIQYIFGNSAFHFQLIGGLLFIGSIIFMFKITELLSGKIAAFFSTIIFFFCFNSIMNSLVHVAYPFIFFVQIACFYFCILGLVRNKLSYFMLSYIFLLPATSKQTTPFIFISIISIYFISHWKTVFPNLKTKLFIFLLALSSFAVIPLSKGASKNTEQLPSSWWSQEMLNFIKERLYYYGDILTTGITGTTLFLITLLYVAFLMLEKIQPSANMHKRYTLLLLPISIILTYVLTHSGNTSIYILFFLLGISFWINKSTRYPLIWFFVSFGIFLFIKFYSGNYLLEGSYGLSIAIGILSYSVVEHFISFIAVNKLSRKNSKKLIIAIILVAVSLSFFLIQKHIPFSGKFEMLQVLINTNKNFSDMIDYLEKELPPDSFVYELSEKSLGLTKEEGALLSIRHRAENKKVMKARDKQAMLRVYGRYDLSFKEIDGIDDIRINRLNKNQFFIVCNKTERDIAEKTYPLKLLKLIKRGKTEAAVYTIE